MNLKIDSFESMYLLLNMVISQPNMFSFWDGITLYTYRDYNNLNFFIAGSPSHVPSHPFAPLCCLQEPRPTPMEWTDSSSYMKVPKGQKGRISGTVDGRNHLPPGCIKNPMNNMIFTLNQLVQDLFSINRISMGIVVNQCHFCWSFFLVGLVWEPQGHGTP